MSHEQQAAGADAWLQSQIHVSPTVDSLVRIKGLTGAAFHSDMSIDDFGSGATGATAAAGVGMAVLRTQTQK